MSDDELLQSLDTYACQLREANAKLIYAAKARIDALRGEVERLKAELNDNSTLAHWAGWKVRALKAEAERDRLKAVLKPRLNAKAIEGLQEILEAMEAMDEREAPFLKTLLDWHDASRKALGDAS